MMLAVQLQHFSLPSAECLPVRSAEQRVPKKKQEVLKNPIRSRMAAHGAIRTMLSSVNDPYTRFLTPDQEVSNCKRRLISEVLGIILESPAQLVGVRQIRRGRCGNPQVFEVERQQDVRSPVYYRLDPVQDSKQMSGYINLKEFNARAKRDILTAMKRMHDAGAASFVLDLRDNPGSLVQAGIEVAQLFLDEGETVIETVGRNASNIRSVLASHSPVTKAPLTILVNDHTASASEIVASALHDNCRAVLVGKRTFDKGLIQAVYELSDGSGVVLTVGKYVTPGQQDIDGAGIEPDYEQLPDSFAT